VSVLFWLTLWISYSYQDATMNCRTLPFGEEVHLAGEMTGDTLTRAQINNYPRQFPFEPIFKSMPLATHQLTTFADKQGRRWLERLRLSESQLAWLVNEAGKKGMSCKVPPIATVEPSVVVQDFEREGIDDGILVSYGQTVDLKGTLQGGRPFQMRFRLTQREYKAGEPLP